MPIKLYRIDDRLIHGQVVVGWGGPLGVQRIILVDDDVAGAEWEQELYRMGVPPEMELTFATAETAAQQHSTYRQDPRVTILLTGSVATMRRLCEAVPNLPGVNLGGVHHHVGRVRKLRYVFLTPEEEAELRAIAQCTDVTAQDVPTARPIPLDEVLSGEYAAE